MISNQIDYAESKKDQLLKLTIRELRLEAKNLSVNLYSRKTKNALVDLILKYQKEDLIEKQIINRKEFSVDIFTEEERIALEKSKAEEERLALEKSKAEEERIAIEKSKAEKEKAILSDKNFNLKRLLSESFPYKKVSVTDNKDGSQTILIL